MSLMSGVNEQPCRSLLRRGRHHCKVDFQDSGLKKFGRLTKTVRNMADGISLLNENYGPVMFTGCTIWKQ